MKRLLAIVFISLSITGIMPAILCACFESYPVITTITTVAFMTWFLKNADKINALLAEE